LGTRWNNVRKLVLIKEDIIMRRLARAEQPGVATEVIIEFHRTDNRRVDNRASRAIPAAITIVSGGEEHDLVVLANDDECNFWIEAHFGASICGEVEGSLGTQRRKMRERRTYFG
jgi:hypothetical protein